MRLRPVFCLALAALATCAVAPETSLGNTDTIGVANPTAGGLTNQVCVASTACTYVPYRGGGPAFVSPVTGTIVRWRIAADSGSAPVALRVLRPVGTDTYMGVGTSATRNTAGGSTDVFATNLPIKAGDVIGLNNDNDALLFKTDVVTDHTRKTTPFLADGSNASFPSGSPHTSPPGYQLQINADIEFTPSSGGGGGGGGGVTTSKPVVFALGVTPFTFTLGTALPTFAVKTGTTIYFTLSQAAPATLTFQRPAAGRKVGSSCVAPTRSNRRKKGCTRYLSAGTLTDATAHSGFNKLAFSGRLSRRKALSPGSYRVMLTARNSFGVSAARFASLRITAPTRHR